MSSVTKNKIMLIKTDEMTFLKITNNSKMILFFLTQQGLVMIIANIH